MPQDVGDTEPTSNPGLKGCTVPAPDGNFPALSIPQTPQDPQSLLLPAAPGRLLRPPAQHKARLARPESQPPPLIPFLSGCGGWTQTGSEEGIGGMGITWGPSPAAGTSAGRAQPGRRRREAGRRVSSRRLRRGPRPADADKAPGSRAPPPPASRPATQRHAHGPRPLRLSLVAPEATRLRPPPAATPPLPGRAGTRYGSPHLAARPDEGRAAPAGRDTCRGSLLSTAAPAVHRGQRGDRDNFPQVRNGAVRGSTGLASLMPFLETCKSRF